MKNSTQLLNNILIVALSCMFEFAKAQIVYTDVNPDQVYSSGSFNLDLNNDGANDFVLTDTAYTTTLSCAQGCGGIFLFHSFKIKPAGNNEIGLDPDDSKLDQGTLIDSNSLSWSTADLSMAHNFHTGTTCNPYVGICFPTGITWSGDWVDGATDKYLGLRIYVSSQTYYGWVRLTVISHAANFTVKDYAYNNCISQSIYAGQMSGGFLVSISGDTSICSGNATTLAASGGNSYLWSTGDSIASILVSPTQTTAYTVQISNDTSVCSVSATVTVNEVDTLVTVSDDTLKAHTTNALYQWIDCASEIPVAGATSQNFSPLQNGIYAVQVTQNGCTDTSSCYAIIANNISENSSGSFRGLFPNPTSDKITLSFSSPEKKQIQITNTLGQIVFSEEINSAMQEINVSEFPAGMYVVSAKTSTQKIEKKFLKQ